MKAGIGGRNLVRGKESVMQVSKGAIRMTRLKRFGVISKVLIKHGLGDIVERISDRARKEPKTPLEAKGFGSGFISPTRIRLVLEELGPSFIKLGQLLSTRADIFPPEYIEEFKKLQDRIPPVQFDDIQQIIEDELKHPVNELFEMINPESIAAASVAQVHFAKLFTGETVAVKVIRPGIRKKMREDIALMYYFANKIEKSFEIGGLIGATNLVEEFERMVQKELDMYVEAGSIEKFANNFKEINEIYIPKVHWGYTTKSVLVMEHIEGIKMDQVEALRAHGIDPKEVAMIGLRAFCRQLMEVGFFHADPHPANTIVMYDGRVSLIDFGITGYLDEETMLQLANLLLGLSERNYDMVMEGLLETAMINAETMDLNSFRMDLKDMCEPFFGRSLRTISVKDVYDQAIALVLKYHIKVPRNLLLLSKTFIQTESLGKILDSDASLLEVARPYAENLLKQGYDARKVLKNIGKDTLYMGKFMKTMPKLFYDALKQLTRGRPQMEIVHSGFQEIDKKIEKSINRLTIGMVISASVIAAALVLNSAQKVIEFEFNLLGLKTISITAILGLIGYTIATILGVWLIFVIFRSGKM
jgi:ubiquinone biosynthesis protein